MYIYVLVNRYGKKALLEHLLKCNSNNNKLCHFGFSTVSSTPPNLTSKPYPVCPKVMFCKINIHCYFRTSIHACPCNILLHYMPMFIFTQHVLLKLKS